MLITSKSILLSGELTPFCFQAFRLVPEHSLLLTPMYKHSTLEHHALCFWNFPEQTGHNSGDSERVSCAVLHQKLHHATEFERKATESNALHNFQRPFSTNSLNDTTQKTGCRKKKSTHWTITLFFTH